MPSGLGARIIGFLSIALVPLGLVAYFQTTELRDATRERARLNVVGLTEKAVSAERRNIETALSVAKTVGRLSAVTGSDQAACNRMMAEVQRSSNLNNYVGVIDKRGFVRCLSVEAEVDLSGYPLILEAVRGDVPSITRVDDPALSLEPVVAVTHPYFQGGVLQGHVFISFPVSKLRNSDQSAEKPGFVDVLTFNKKGQILSSTITPSEAREYLPPDTNFAELALGQRRSFRATSADGQERIFSVSSIVPDVVTAVSVWPLDSLAAEVVEENRLARSLPFLMWAASVIVAYLAVNRLVIRHIRNLRLQMRGFARDRRIPENKGPSDMALELRDMENDFLNMVESIIRDEAHLENTLREKTILLKEVHHRVKNNLQLISSIMNMQIRQANHAETRQVLHRLQDRILGLAAVHRTLYQSGDLGQVQAHEMLSNLIDQVADLPSEVGLESEVLRELDAIELYPDQAVPLSLLAAEALTNAGKYVSPDDQGRCFIKLTLKKFEPNKVELTVTNSVGKDIMSKPGPDSGLGSRLIRAFSTQLGGELEQNRDGQRFIVKVSFGITEFEPQVVDY